MRLPLPESIMWRWYGRYIHGFTGYLFLILAKNPYDEIIQKCFMLSIEFRWLLRFEIRGN